MARENNKIIILLSGIKPWPFHFSSILFHSLCGLLLYFIFLRLLYPKITLPVIVLMDMLWLSLPIHNEELAVTTGLASPSILDASRLACLFIF